MTILVTGGAGYIGSHVVKALGVQNEKIIVLDNLSTGHKSAVKHGTLVVGDLSDANFLNELFLSYNFEAVLHFAGSIVVPESVRNPLKYYANNTINTFNLIKSCVDHGVEHFIFSSTAAVYGIPENGNCSEQSQTNPINPYGHSKLMSEKMLFDATNSSPLTAIVLRYFNVAGADSEGELGQSFPEATHLIKVASEVVTGKRKSLQIYGADYPTEDGTCVRDYIHVSDLADAHVKALNYLRKGGDSAILNCGYGKGFSVKEVVDRVKKISGIDFDVQFSPRREGDPAFLVAKADLIQTKLSWKPRFDDLNYIIKTALHWEKTRSY